MMGDSYLESKNKSIDFSKTMYHFTIILYTKKFYRNKIKEFKNKLENHGKSEIYSSGQ
jgi:hypothetical protein